MIYHCVKFQYEAMNRVYALNLRAKQYKIIKQMFPTYNCVKYSMFND